MNSTNIEKLLSQLESVESIYLIKDYLKLLTIKNEYEKKVMNKLHEIGVNFSPISETKQNYNFVYNNIIYYKNISRGCQDCFLDQGCTVRVTTKCNRNCFFCFSTEHEKQQKDLSIDKLKVIIDRKLKDSIVNSFAISGGEPFLYPEKVFELLDYVDKKFDQALYKRIYTNGDLLNENILMKIEKYKVNEIRFSVKPYEKINKKLLNIAKNYVENILVEVPVIPGHENYLKNIINDLEEIKITGLNLIELFYNGINTKEFKNNNLVVHLPNKKIREFYELKPIHEYPIYGSHSLAIKLMNYIASKQISFFVHYCSNGTKNLQYKSKIKRIAEKNINNVTTLTPNNTHKYLCIYSDFSEANQIIAKNNIKDYIINKTHNDYIANIITNIKYIDLFSSKNILLTINENDPQNQQIVDIQIVSLKKENISCFESKKLLTKFKKYLYAKN